MLNEYIKERTQALKLSPLVGESVNRQVDERGKCEQKRKNKKISMSKTNKKYSDLCTQTCPYRLARLGTSLRIRGKLTLRKKKYSFYYLNTLFVINLCRILRYESDYVLSSIIVPNLAAAQE